MPAIERAWQLGAHGIEVDVRATAEAEFVLLHDATLARTTDVHQIFPLRQDNPVHTFSLAELGRLDAGSWFIDTDPFGQIAAGQLSDHDLETIRGVHIPTLAEVLLFVKKRSWFVNIELKELPHPALVDELVSLVEKLQMPSSCFSLSSFNHDYLRHLRDTRPDLEINALIGGDVMRPQNWGTFEFAVYNANADLTDEAQIARALDQGCQVNLYTVNEPGQMKRFLQAGVSKIFTDFPQRLKLVRLD